MQTRQEKKESGQIAKIDNKDLLGFASKNPKESILRKSEEQSIRKVKKYCLPS